jgi:hypothetical protein
MNHLIFSGEWWRELDRNTSESSLSPQNCSRSSLMAIADGFVDLYRQIYLEPGGLHPTHSGVAMSFL